MTTTTYPTWKGFHPIPAVGQRVRVALNGLGKGTVTAHFVEEGFLGVAVALDAAPDWYVTQNGPDAPAHVFGLEIDPLTADGQLIAQPITNEARARLIAGTVLRCGSAVLSYDADGSAFRLASPHTGTHTLAADATDNDRLSAHWSGFVARSHEGNPA